MAIKPVHDILERSRIKINNKKLNDYQKKALFKIPYSTLVELIENTTLINRQVASDLMKMNNIRQRYIHPTLGGDLYEDAKKSINLLCHIIDLYKSI
ncbi:MAG: hypothetical protein ACRD8Z_07680 [Nitrososphaeraceae archaeon]